MLRHQIKLGLWIVLFSLLPMIKAYAAVQDPVQLLRSIADDMIKGLKANQNKLKADPHIAFDLANRYVVPHADISVMSRRVIPPTTWDHATPEERSEFQAQFTQTLVRTYASSLTAYRNQSVQFYPVRGGYTDKKLVEVRSDITSPSDNQPINVNYRLIREGDDWKIVDMSVDGVDMLDSFRSQFDEILSRKNMHELIQQMIAHNHRT